MSERGKALAKLAALAALIVGGILLARLSPLGDFLTLEGVNQAVDGLRGSRWAPVIFVSAYALATALAIPGTILTFAGGALFGVVWGSVFNLIAANLGANAAFWIARSLGRDSVKRLTGDRLGALDSATENHGFQGLLTLRLIPVVPFNALNFGSGLTAISWRAYALATGIGIVPGTVVYTNFADAFLAGSQDASREALIRVALSGGLLLLLSLLPTILKRLRVRLPGAMGSLVVLALPLGGAEAQTATPTSGDLVDPAPLTSALGRVVGPTGVDYASLQADRSKLDTYLASLAAVSQQDVESADRSAQLSFWINAYNACMLRLVTDHYPIQKSGGGLFGAVKGVFVDRPDNSVWQIDDVFERDHCPVAGATRSQDEIEHEILREMSEPRIHFAVNCAAVSCPPLRAEAYTAEKLEEQLDEQVRAFVATERHFVLEPGDEPVLMLNKVLDWYSDDFSGRSGLVEFFKPYVDPSRRRILDQDAIEVEFFDYDWALNDERSGAP